VLVRAARPGDVVVTLGAGSIGSVPDRLVQALEQSRGADA
jgi:UDP-N-acetylmuramate-alanine ligase